MLPLVQYTEEKEFPESIEFLQEQHNLNTSLGVRKQEWSWEVLTPERRACPELGVGVGQLCLCARCYPEKVFLDQDTVRHPQRKIQFSSFRLSLKHRLAVALGECFTCHFGPELVLRKGLGKHARLQSCVVVCDVCSHERWLSRLSFLF